MLLVAAIAACTDEQIVEVERPPFNQPADASSGFLGYYTAGTKQTTCGNCHADFQAAWVQTAHAGAYAAVKASPAAQPSCYSCHSLTAKGNNATGPAGHDKVSDSAYYDVQCENCHGPGLEHVKGVNQGQVVRPLAKLSLLGTGNCADCHSGSHRPFVEQWRASGHANVNASRAGNTASGCSSCHDGRGALAAWGVTSNYQERDQAAAYQPTTCAVCHSPHGSKHTRQLRFSISSPDPEQNLCMKCHMRRNEPTVTQTSPHAPQGALLLGTAGYRPPGFPEPTLVATHGSAANPRLCAGCHVTKFDVRDPLTNTVIVQSPGHLFRPVPCLDEAGVPTGDKTCAYTTAARSWKSCTGSGCHATEAVAASAFTSLRAVMRLLTNQLWTDTNGSGSMQAAPTDAGLLPTLRQTRPTEWSTTDNRITLAEGAEFNARLCGEYQQSNSDNSKGVHNPFLCQALLVATIEEVRRVYALPAPPAEVQQVIDEVMAKPQR